MSGAATEAGKAKRATHKGARAGTDLFSTGQAARIRGVRMRTADYWAKIGLATAWVEAAGVGSDRWYRYDDLVVLAAIADLQDTTTIALKRLVAQEIRTSSPTREFVMVEFESFILSINMKRIRERVTAAIAKEARHER